ncbi:hypothetical protein IMG5_205760 [Ichthyophthirius multifiliis]|uniref:Transmembrane protein n=1 Tax=Ichthyophthirius multifiliis TaxID=5932 RepID=G0R6K6_ICHMU|nr:hypothetical protein IMG5_205760 [Ichthyophthirius multifiliis]EGR26896.1 hypothetical protein IMG5_205760 [Ichthyophthirius multifiliis]|eukprot:XP_004023780.1 hypothetical protein IMG5_205760 [Ichthyophthirius multifiliis]
MHLMFAETKYINMKIVDKQVLQQIEIHKNVDHKQNKQLIALMKVQKLNQYAQVHLMMQENVCLKVMEIYIIVKFGLINLFFVKNSLNNLQNSFLIQQINNFKQKNSILLNLEENQINIVEKKKYISQNKWKKKKIKQKDIFIYYNNIYFLKFEFNNLFYFINFIKGYINNIVLLQQICFYHFIQFIQFIQFFFILILSNLNQISEILFIYINYKQQKVFFKKYLIFILIINVLKNNINKRIIYYFINYNKHKDYLSIKAYIIILKIYILKYQKQQYIFILKYYY